MGAEMSHMWSTEFLRGFVSSLVCGQEAWFAAPQMSWKEEVWCKWPSQWQNCSSSINLAPQHIAPHETVSVRLLNEKLKVRQSPLNNKYLSTNGWVSNRELSQDETNALFLWTISIRPGV
uniref:Uncharacterized protein n=1 Tax=Timema bartmani TaxID=61472 RepID=A0A7R9EXM2_9NEOP|nr:unnamed protein product [Timema bartmani]